MKIVIVGGSGTIGSQLGETLTSNITDLCLVSLGRSNTKEHHKTTPPLKDKNAWKALLVDTDVLVNLAGVTKVNKDTYNHSRIVNVDMAKTLFEYAAEFSVPKYIFMSSIGVCAGHHSSVTIRENTSYKPNNLYAETKVDAELELLKVAATSETKLSIVRPPMVYCSNSRGPLRLLMKFINKGLYLPFAGVNNKRYHISLTNLCSFIEKLIHTNLDETQVYVVADKKPVSSKRLVKLLADGMGRSPRLIYIPPSLLRVVFTVLGMNNLADSLLNDLKLDTQKARTLINWTPIENVDKELIKVGKDYKEMTESE